MRCPVCAATDVIQIEQTLPDGTEVTFFSCHKCEEKWWDRAGEALSLAQVLELAKRSD